MDVFHNRIDKMLSETIRTKNISETKEYHYKKDAMTDFFKGILSADELIKISKDDFRVDVASKKELDDFLVNSFMQEMMADQYGIKKSALIKRVKELLKKIK